MKQNVKIFFITVLFILICCIHLHASDLRWDASTGEVTGYTIYYGLSQGNYTFSEDIGNVTQYSLENFSLSEGTTYYFMVRAYNVFGESSNSNVATYLTPSTVDTTPPLPPGNVSGEVVNEDILVTWVPNSEIDFSGYRVYYGGSSRNYGLPIPNNGTNYSITGLEKDIAYYIAVTSVDTSGNESGFSSPEIVKIIPTAIVGSLLKWNAVTGDVSGYKIYYGISEGSYTEEADVGNVTEYALDNFSLTTGISYYFVVRAYNAYGESSNSNVATYLIGTQIDTVAPVVIIGSPTTSTSYNTIVLNIDVSGTASDNTAVTQVTWSNSLGGNGIASGTTSWSVVGITLSEGENIIVITARDEAGNESTDILTVTYIIPDTTAPLVTILSPTTDTSYNTETGNLNMGGSASDEVGVTMVSWRNSAGGSGAVSGIDNWNVSGITLSEGENIITITATDAAGNESTDQLTVGYDIPDVIKPSVVIDTPTSETNFYTEGSNLTISGTASDNKGITQVVWENNAGGSGTASGTTFWSVGGMTLSEGENIVVITARDEAGNESTDILTVTYIIPDTTAPLVTILSPTTDISYNTEIGYLNMGGSASDEVGVTMVSWRNSAGGSGAVSGIDSELGVVSGIDNWNVSGITLSEGENIITITAIDAAGNESTDSLTAQYVAQEVDTTPPKIKLLSPSTRNRFFVRKPIVSLKGNAADDTGIQKILWSNSKGGSGRALGTTEWSIPDIALAKYWNVITIKAIDLSGNESILKLYVFGWY